MRLKYEFETVEIDDEILAVPVGDNADQLHGLLRLNETAADILSHLKKETTEEQVVEDMLKVYDIDRESLTAHVHNYILKLQEAGVLA